MAATDLQQHLIEAGHKLLATLDDAGVKPQGAAWIFDHALEDWRYVVATSLVDTMGRSTVYRMLLSIMKKLNMPEELTIADIHLVSSSDPLFKAIASVFDIHATATFRNCVINGMEFDAVVYRWTGHPSPSGCQQDREALPAASKGTVWMTEPKKPKTPDKAPELRGDSWRRFERAVDAAVKGGPRHRPSKTAAQKGNLKKPID